MMDRPTAPELLETIAGVLENEVLPELEGAAQHKVRVAANLCRILEREFQLGPGVAAREIERLQALLGEPREGSALALNDALRERLERAADPEFEARALGVLLEIVRDKLAVAKPGHDDYDFSEEWA